MLVTVLVTLLTGLVFLILAIVIPANGAWALYSILAFFLLLVSYPVNSYLREFFKTKYKVKTPVFLVCVCVPSLIAAEIANLAYISSPPNGEAANFITIGLIAWLIVSGVLTFWLVIGAFIASIKARRK